MLQPTIASRFWQNRQTLTRSSKIRYRAPVADNIYVMLLNRQSKVHQIGAIDVAFDGKAFTPNLIEGVQLTHRSDMALAEAMQNTDRCVRVELKTDQRSLTLPPYSITRSKLTVPKM